MVLTCPACASKSSIDDRKVPPRAFQAKCAKCGHLFRVDPTAPAPAAEHPEPAPVPEPEPEPRSEPAPPPAPPPASPAPAAAVAPAAPPAEPYRPAAAPSSIPQGVTDLVRVLAGLQTIEEEAHAVVCAADGSEAAALERVLAGMGYHVERSADLAEGMSRVDDWPAFVAVGHAFPEDADGGKTLLRKVAGFAPERRRGIVAMLISPKYKSMDGLAAFVLGADFVIASSDLGRAAELVREGMRGKEQMYRAFRRAQAKLRA